MLRKILIIVVIAVMGTFCLNGCKEGPGDAGAGQEEVKTAAEYEAEAKEQINKDNMTEELERIEKEVDQDISQDQ